MIDRIVHCIDQLVQARHLFVQRVLMALQRAQHIEVTSSYELLDIIQRNIQFPVKQDLLQPQKGILP